MELYQDFFSRVLRSEIRDSSSLLDSLSQGYIEDDNDALIIMHFFQVSTQTPFSLSIHLSKTHSTCLQSNYKQNSVQMCTTATAPNKTLKNNKKDKPILFALCTLSTSQMGNLCILVKSLELHGILSKKNCPSRLFSLCKVES